MPRKYDIAYAFVTDVCKQIIHHLKETKYSWFALKLGQQIELCKIIWSKKVGKAVFKNCSMRIVSDEN